MEDLRLACTGARIGSLCIPPFQLRAAGLICLHLPHPVPDGAEVELVRHLTGECSVAGLRVLGRVVAASPAHDERNTLLRFLRPMRASAWLRRRTGMSLQEAESVLRRLGLEKDWPLTHLPSNPRALLGLETAWAVGAEGIVFGTSGLDPSGVRAVYTTIGSRLSRCPAVHLSRLLFQNGRPLRDCSPDARCIELTDVSVPSLPAESA